MKFSTRFFVVALAGGLCSSSVFAQSAAKENFVAPAVKQVVSPTGLPRNFEGMSVTLALSVDAAGRPTQVRVVSPRDERLAQSLIRAVSQWVFAPARRNGVPVATEVILPLELVDGPLFHHTDVSVPAVAGLQKSGNSGSKMLSPMP